MERIHIKEGKQGASRAHLDRELVRITVDEHSGVNTEVADLGHRDGEARDRDVLFLAGLDPRDGEVDTVLLFCERIVR